LLDHRVTERHEGPWAGRNYCNTFRTSPSGPDLSALSVAAGELLPDQTLTGSTP